MNRPTPAIAISNTEMVSKFVAEWSARARTTLGPRGAFVLDGAPLSDDDVAGPAALLPVFVWHAENLYRFAVNSKGLGAEYRPDSQSLLGRSINADRVHRSTSELLCFVLEALEDASANLPASSAVPGAVELRAHVNQFAAAFRATPAVAEIPAQPAARPQV